MMRDIEVRGDGKSAINRLTGDDSIYDMVAAERGMALAPEAQVRVAQLMESMRGGETKVRSRFLLDVMFNTGRSAFRPYDGLIVAYTNGGFNHGGGDEMVYFCPRKVEKNGQTKICATPLPPIAIKGKIAVCPVCESMSHDRELIGQVYAKLSVENWTALVTRMFYRLDCNADIRICVLRDDLHRATEDEQARNRGGDQFRKLYEDLQWVRYNLASMIQDTASGATLEHCINAFLRA